MFFKHISQQFVKKGASEKRVKHMGGGGWDTETEEETERAWKTVCEKERAVSFLLFPSQFQWTRSLFFYFSFFFHPTAWFLQGGVCYAAASYPSLCRHARYCTTVIKMGMQLRLSWGGSTEWSERMQENESATAASEKSERDNVPIMPRHGKVKYEPRDLHL